MQSTDTEMLTEQQRWTINFALNPNFIKNNLSTTNSQNSDHHIYDAEFRLFY